MTSVVCGNLRGLCYGCLLYFVYDANYASLFPMKLSKLPVNDKNTASCKQIRLLGISEVLYKTVHRVKMNFEMLSV